MLILAAFTVILSWPEASAEAARRAGELGAGVLVVPLAASAPAAPAGVEIIAAVPADAASIHAARRAGFRGVMIPAPEQEPALRALLAQHRDFIRVVSLAPAQAHQDVSPALAAVRAGRWPGLEAADGEAGATEQPWINANLHVYSWLRGFFPQRAPVLDFAPPDDSLQYEGAEIALAEAWAFRGSVILRLPGAMREGLARGDARAASSWSRLCEVAAFLRSRAPAGPFVSASSLAMLIPQWDEEFEEILNLAWRQQLAPEVVPAGRFAPRQGLRFAASVNHTPPAPVRQQLREFAAAGGTVVIAPEPGKPPAPWTEGARRLGKEGPWEKYALGRGALRLFAEPVLDPYEFALHLREIVGMDNPLGRGLHGLDVRIWNAATVLPVLSRHGGGVQVVLIAYGRRLDHDFLAGIRGRWRRAELLQPGASAVPLRLMQRAGRVEWNQPGLPRLAVVTLEEDAR